MYALYTLEKVIVENDKCRHYRMLPFVSVSDLFGGMGVGGRGAEPVLLPGLGEIIDVNGKFCDDDI